MPGDSTAGTILALDQGGQGSRAIIFDRRGRELSRSERRVATWREGDTRVEQDPEELVRSLEVAMKTARARLARGSGRIAAAGLACQRSSVVAWDRSTGEALTPVLSWQDRRGWRLIDDLRAHENTIRARTGLRLSPHYGASKLRWCLEHVDAVRAAADEGRLAWGPLASFLCFRLCAERPSPADAANAQRTLLWGLEAGRWEPHLLDLFGLPGEPLPACVDTIGEHGSLRAEGGRIPLRALNGDQSAALFAAGAPPAGVVTVNIGTGAFLQGVLEEDGSDPRAAAAAGLLTGVVLGGRERQVRVLEGSVNGAGAALRWLAAERGLPDLERRLPGWLERAEGGGEAERLPLFLNGISGLGSPFWIADYPSRFAGDGEAWQQAVAVAESIVFLIAANLEAMARVAGAATRISVTGGLSRLDALCRRLAALAGVELHRPAATEATARGVAWLAAGCPQEWPSPGPGRIFEPAEIPGLSDRYRRWQERITAP
ncbi:MAG: FGGY family carbohydrate kinase [Planctomycetota bacterium]